MVNKAILIGNLGREPDIRRTQTGTAVCNFTIATSEKWKDKNSGEMQERTEWHRIVAFGKLAEICGQYLSKGQQVFIDGRLQTRSWEQDGVPRYTTEIVASEMKMLSNNRRHGKRAVDDEQEAYAPDPPPDDDDDIPPF